ncbi:hypothetical protein AB4Z45_31940 [Paenibacillus sp. MCAF9]|uniref:hypothetical protein n=1 Tax=Paenibacillus sp. MCAF9 TaxID=3233046 RepID=UPI003F99FA6C
MNPFIEQLLHSNQMEIELTEDILFEIYNEAKNTDGEEEAWKNLISLYDKPLPKQIAFSLIDRNIAIMDLGHSKQDYDVLWRLAEIVDEALLTLAIDVYTQLSFGHEEMELLFNKYDNHKWMMESLIYKQPSSPEKRRLLEAAIKRNMDADRLQRLLTVVDAAKYTSRNDLTLEEFQSLFETKEPYVWLSLAQNANTPVYILNKLLEATSIKNARAIRHSANINIQGKRGNNSEVIT